MSGFLELSLWVVLAEVVPGIMSIGCLYGAYEMVNPGALESTLRAIPADIDWVWSGLVVSATVMTHVLGTLVEGVLVTKKWLGPEIQEVDIPHGVASQEAGSSQLNPYSEFENRYVVLTLHDEHHANHAQLKRIFSRFLLANNILVSLGMGIAFAIVNFVISPSWHVFGRCIGYSGVMVICLVLTYKLAVIRFNDLARSLWASRMQSSAL